MKVIYTSKEIAVKKIGYEKGKRAGKKIAFTAVVVALDDLLERDYRHSFPHGLVSLKIKLHQFLEELGGRHG